MSETIIVADIGGTNARFATSHISANNEAILENIIVKSVANFATPNDALEEYLKETGAKAKFAQFAIAAVPDEEEIRFTNSHWIISKSKIKEQFGFNHAGFMNDFAAMAYGAIHNKDDQFEIIKSGINKENAPIIVTGPGTGLGLASMVKFNNEWHILPSEAGHQAFAPRDKIEIEILKILSNAFPEVSFEHLVSGQGLERVYKCLCNIYDKPQEFETAQEIGNEALAKPNSLAAKSAAIMMRMFATFCSNAVLAVGAQGGVIIAGGVANILSKFINTQQFIDRFSNIGIMSHYIRDIPIKRNLDNYAALRGAAIYAIKEA